MSVLDFDTVYRLDRSDGGGPFRYLLMVAGATSEDRELPSGGEYATFYRFCSNQDDPHPVFYVFAAKVEVGDDGTVKVVDAEAKKQGRDVVYRLRPVTLELAKEVSGAISAYDATIGKLETDADLQNFFRAGLIPDDWSRVSSEND